MAPKTVTRALLGEAVYREVGLSRSDSAALVESVLKEVSDALALGEQVKISTFGSFILREKEQRPGRNPKTGEEAPILARKVLVFRASPVLKDRINGSKSVSGNHCKDLEVTMTKSYTCRDVGVDCDWKTSAETEDEVMAAIQTHAAQVHPTIELTPELVEAVRAAIKDE